MVDSDLIEEITAGTFTPTEKSVSAWTPRSHWDENKNHIVPDWQYEVLNNNTRLGYHDWVNAQLSLKEADG